MMRCLLRRTLFFIAVVLLASAGLKTSPVFANGIPVQIFLDHLPFKATWSPAAGGRGVAVISANDEQVRVMAQNLPALPADQVYYAWLEQADGGFLPVGALRYASDGTASIDQHMEALPHSEAFSWVLISLEDPANVGNAPARDVALAGKLPNALALPPTGNQVPALLPVTGGEVEPERSPLSITLVIGATLLVIVSIYGGARRLQAKAARIETTERKRP
jgi:hypothetical protein